MSRNSKRKAATGLLSHDAGERTGGGRAIEGADSETSFMGLRSRDQGRFAPHKITFFLKKLKNSQFFIVLLKGIGENIG